MSEVQMFRGVERNVCLVQYFDRPEEANHHKENLAHLGVPRRVWNYHGE